MSAAEFRPFSLREHRLPAARALHHIGAMPVFACPATGIVTGCR